MTSSAGFENTGLVKQISQVVRKNIIGCMETKKTSWIYKEITHIHRKQIAVFDSWIIGGKMSLSFGEANYKVCILHIWFFLQNWDCCKVCLCSVETIFF